VHNAVNQFAADTLIIIRPRHGLQIAPIDLARERLAAGTATRHRAFRGQARDRSDASLSHRNQALHNRTLAQGEATTASRSTIHKLDRRIDTLLLAASGEPFLTHTLRPLHTIYRASASSIIATCRQTDLRHHRSPHRDPQRVRKPARR